MMNHANSDVRLLHPAHVKRLPGIPVKLCAARQSDLKRCLLSNGQASAAAPQKMPTGAIGCKRLLNGPWARACYSVRTLSAH